MEDISNFEMKDLVLEETNLDDLFAFEPDFELLEELEACKCLCGIQAGSGAGGGGGNIDLIR